MSTETTEEQSQVTGHAAASAEQITPGPHSAAFESLEDYQEALSRMMSEGDGGAQPQSTETHGEQAQEEIPGQEETGAQESQAEEQSDADDTADAPEDQETESKESGESEARRYRIQVKDDFDRRVIELSRRTGEPLHRIFEMLRAEEAPEIQSQQVSEPQAETPAEQSPQAKEKPAETETAARIRALREEIKGNSESLSFDVLPEKIAELARLEAEEAVGRSLEQAEQARIAREKQAKEERDRVDRQRLMDAERAIAIQEAEAEFPDLTDKDSALRKLVDQKIDQRRKSNDPMLGSPRAPLDLASLAAAELGILPRSRQAKTPPPVKEGRFAGPAAGGRSSAAQPVSPLEAEWTAAKDSLEGYAAFAARHFGAPIA